MQPDNSSQKEIVESTKNIHPEISDAVVKMMDEFLLSEDNKVELSSASLKRITEELLTLQLKKKEDEN